jgi:hypothetical protein
MDNVRTRKVGPRVLNWRRAIPQEDPAVARVTAISLALASELAVARERIDTLERLLQGAGVLTAGAVDAYEPDPAAQAARDALRQGQIRRIFRPLQVDAENAARDAGGAV